MANLLVMVFKIESLKYQRGPVCNAGILIMEPTQFTPVLGWCYLFKLLPNPTLTITLMLVSSATYS